MRQTKLLAVVAVLFLSRSYGQVVVPSEDSEAIQKANFALIWDFTLNDKIPDLVAKAVAAHRSSVFIAYPDVPLMHQHASKGPLPGADLALLAANSDLVVEGIPESRKSGACQMNTFVCSDYTVFVTRIWKNNGVAVIAGQTIIAARAGGEFTLNGISVHGIDPNFHLFKLHEKYVFFLKQVPESGAFIVHQGHAFLEDQNQIVDARTKRGMSPTDHDVFMKELERAVAVPFRGAR